MFIVSAHFRMHQHVHVGSKFDWSFKSGHHCNKEIRQLQTFIVSAQSTGTSD